MAQRFPDSERSDENGREHARAGNEPCGDACLDVGGTDGRGGAAGAGAPVPFVHPEAAAMFALCPWTAQLPLFSDSSKSLGPRGVTALGLCYFLNKGLGSYLVKYCRYAMFTSRFGIDGTRYQRLSTLYTMGWSVKAFSACVSDTFALFGYTKRWYCAGSCVAGAAFGLAFGLLPAKVESANIGAGFMFLTNFCMANVDILSEGHYSRILRKRPEAGPALVSWIWVFIFMAALTSAGIQGPLSDKKIPQVGLFISAACQAVTVFFFIFNWYGERYNRVERYQDFLFARADTETASSNDDNVVADAAAALTQGKDLQPERSPKSVGVAGAAVHPHDSPAALSDELVPDARVVEDGDDLGDVDQSAYLTPLCGGAVEVNREVFSRNWRLFVYSAVMVAAVTAQSLVTVYGTSHDLGWSSLVVAVVCCGMAFWACTLVTAKAIVFLFMDQVLYVQISGVTDSFYLATEACLPDGPHFNYVFYNTVAAIIGNVGGIAGVFCFSYIFSKRGYWFTFIVTTTLKVIGSVFDIIMVKRWNLAIGIPDHAMYILGDSIVYQLCNEMAWMPVVLLFSRICPRGSESIIYALAAGFGNMGQSISGTIGSLFIELVWPMVTKGTHGECDFSHAPMLLFITHILMPLGVIPLSILLLPRARICDDIDADGNVIAHKKESTNASDSRRDDLDESAALPPGETAAAKGRAAA